MNASNPHLNLFLQNTKYQLCNSTTSGRKGTECESPPVHFTNIEILPSQEIQLA